MILILFNIKVLFFMRVLVFLWFFNWGECGGDLEFVFCEVLLWGFCGDCSNCVGELVGGVGGEIGLVLFIVFWIGDNCFGDKGWFWINLFKLFLRVFWVLGIDS